MSSISRLLHFASLILISAALNAQTLAQEQQPGSVDGRVTNAQNADAISGAALHLYPLIRRGAGRLQEAQATTSQADGTFHFDAVPPGTYLLSAEHAGFVAAVLNHRPLSVSVAPGQQVTNLAIQLNPQATISGKVLDEKGEPVPGARVEAYSTYTARGKARLRRGRATTANKTGDYLLKNIAPGTYYLAAEPSRDAEKAKPTAKPDSDPTVLELVRTFYPNALDFEASTPLEITAGQDLPGTDIRLRGIATYRLAGKIAESIPGNPGRSWMLSLASRSSLASDAAGRIVRPNPDGTFEIDKVAPGSYTLTLTGRDNSTAQIGMRNSHPRLLARQDIDVGASDVNGIVLSIIPPVNFTGRVTVEDLNNPNVSQVHVNLVPAGDLAVGGFQSLPVKIDGTFVAEGLDPGEYAVRIVGSPPGTYVKSILFNRQDVTTTGMDVSEGGSGELEIVLRTGAAEVDGSVESAQATSARISVVLVPEALAQDGFGTLFGSVLPPGNFAIKNVPPGHYYAFAVERYSSVWQSTDFLREMQSHGLSIDVPENGHLQIQLPITTEEQVQQVAAVLGLAAQ